MHLKLKFYTPLVAAIVLFTGIFLPLSGLAAQNVELDNLFTELQSSDEDVWQQSENRIEKIWSHSGSDSMDLLLERGRSSMKSGDFEKAVEHFTALTDHAPEFTCCLLL